jgi:hypothetical protein
VAICDESEAVASGILDELRQLEPEPVTLSSATTVEDNRDPNLPELQGASISFSLTYNSVVRIYGISGQEDPKRPITAEEAMDRARRAIRDFNLTQLNENVTPENILGPVKVKRLDRIDGDYYLVPAGVRNRISAFINISVRGEFNEATVWPAGHYVAPFELHPDFRDLTNGRDSSLRGRKIRLTAGGSPPKNTGVNRAETTPLTSTSVSLVKPTPLTITSVSLDGTTPYVWRPSPAAFSMSRPFLNLKITVQERAAPISFYIPVDDYCLPVDDTGAITLPSANYLELLADCIKQKAGNAIGEVLVVINRRGNTVMVMYKSNQIQPIEDELEDMTKIICQCLKAHPSDGVTHFRIKAYASNAFLTKRRGGGDDGPLISAPASGGGGDGIPISDC